MNIRSLCALIVCLGLTACIATPIEDMAPPQWQLTESFEDGEDGPPVNTQPAFLAGSWAGPQQIGGCLDSATWSTYGSTGVFERVFVNNNQCTPEQVGVYACEGTWSVLKVRGTSGVMTRSCSLDGPVSAPQITRETLTSTFSVLDGGRALNFEVWRMSEDEQRFERRETRINRYNETGPQGAQLMETSFTSTLELLDAQGNAIMNPSEELDLAIDESFPVEVRLEVSARVSLDPSGLRESATRMFALEGDLVRRDDEQYILDVRFGEASTAPGEAWRNFLGEQEFFSSYEALGAVFMQSFQDGLRWDVQTPKVWWAGGRGEMPSLPNPCARYEDTYGALLADRCAQQ